MTTMKSTDERAAVRLGTTDEGFIGRQLRPMTRRQLDAQLARRFGKAF